MTEIRYAYLHGFASSALSRKGVALAERFAEVGRELLLPDLNRPSFSRLSHDACLAALDELAGTSGRLRFIGSSFGGWLAARWAQLHPDRTDRLLLLCPGLSLADRWPELLGAEQMARWKSEGQIPFQDANKSWIPVHYGFFEESVRQPDQPQVPCPTHIVHGRRDEIVSIANSRLYAASRPHVQLIEVDDDHSLASSIERIWLETRDFLLVDG